ncbi:MAG: hypothetical protein IJ094_05305 [Bacilli bacterium]|nr:hypothetical protein [Bacilli bacterium]
MNYFKELGMFNFVTSNNPDEKIIGAMIYDNEEDYTDYDDEDIEYSEDEYVNEEENINNDI